MGYFTAEKMTDRITRITDPAGTLMYLVEGDRRAALIDSGVGVGSLKEFVCTLTEKPVFMLLTHGHLDHALGAVEFDEVYMNEKDKQILAEHSNMEKRIDYVKNMVERNGHPEWSNLPETEYMPAPKPEKLKVLEEGDIFELGGITLEMYALPGHTPGSIAVLFKEERLLLTGDAACTATILEFAGSPSIEEYKENLTIFKKKLNGLYDNIIVSHGPDQYKEDMIDTLITVCDEIMAGTDEKMPMMSLNGDKYCYAARKMSWGFGGNEDGSFGNIIYDRKNIFKK